MISRFIAITVLIAIAIMGCIELRRRHRDLGRRVKLVAEYLKKFAEFAQKAEFDGHLYGWLVSKSVEVQVALGSLGVMTYKPAGGFYMIPGYAVIVNLLPDIAKWKSDWPSWGGTYAAEVNMYQETLLRYVGFTDTRLKNLAKRKRNPLRWLAEGIRLILLVPILMLNSVGMASASFTDRVRASSAFRTITGLVTLVSLAVNVATIVVGWNELSRFVADLWRRVF